MKKNISLIIFLFVGTHLFAQSKSLNSTIEKVTVFFSGAQISRTATTSLSTGKSELVFKGLTPSLDTRSIQVRGEGDFTVLSVTPRTNFLESAAKRDTIRDLEAQLDVLQDRLALENNQISAFQQEETFLQRNQVQILGVQNTTMKLEDLKQVGEYQRLRIVEILNKKFEIQKDVSKLNLDIIRVRLQLSEMNAKKNTISSEIVVVVNAPSATSAKFFVSYVVPNAAWAPTYDMRVKDISTPLSMLMKADVKQGTGEDWKDVKLTLSSGNPMESGMKPELQPWRLAFFQPVAVYSSYNNNIQAQIPSNFRRNPSITQIAGIVTDNRGEPLPGASVIVKGTTIGVQTDINGRFSLVLPPAANVLALTYIGFYTQEIAITSHNLNVVLQENPSSLSEVVVVSSRGGKRKDVSRPVLVDKIGGANSAEAPETDEVVKPTTVNYEITETYSIPADNKPQSVEIKSLDLPATYQYFVAPKLDKDAFLTAQIIDWEQYNLLSGEANLFFEGTFMGKTILNTLITDDTLNISLGRDKNVVVTRTKLKDFTKTRFLSDKRTDSRAFETTVKNKRGQSLSIIVEDQIPISTTKEIEIETDTGNATVDAPTGKLTWKLDVPSGKDKKVKFSYTAKYPKGQRVILE